MSCEGSAAAAAADVEQLGVSSPGAGCSGIAK